MNDFNKFAIDLAQRAGEVMKKNFTLEMKKEWKNDNTPITITDTTINQMVLDAVGKAYPSHGVLAEEGSREGKSEYVWVCDPVDGTVPFSHGYPTFVFSLALVKDGKPTLGIIYDPLGDRLVYAEEGKGAFLNEKKVSVSLQKKISRASLINFDSDHRLLSLREHLIKKTDCYGTVFVCGNYAGLLVAVGEFVAEVFEYKNAWDAAAVKIIVEEAGGKVTDIFGNDQRYDRQTNGFIASNGKVHQELLDAVKSILEKKK